MHAVARVGDHAQLSLGLPIVWVGLRQLEVLHELLEARLVLEEALARELQGGLDTVRAAQHLLLKGWPIMLAGPPGDEFANEHGVEQMERTWFETKLRRAQWQKWKSQRLRPGATDEEDALLDHDGDEEGWGTVGAVALDVHGHVAAATSTGGMTGKPVGRVGDTPIIGAGTWADQTIAVSCTGVGEAFIRTAAAHSVAVHHRVVGLEEAADKVLNEVEPLGGRGGLIAVNTEGKVVMPFQTMLMYRGVYIDGTCRVGIGPDFIQS